MTIEHNNGPVILFGDDFVPGEDEKILDSVDLQKIKEKIKDKPLDLDTEQFILVGMSPRESVIRKAKESIRDFQVSMRELVNEIWTLMDVDDNDRPVDEWKHYGKKADLDYSEIQERLTELISHTERVKKKLY